jgi:hypothetical protein
MNSEILHKQVWTRFIRMPYGHLLDYADENGEAIYPTKEECDRAMPNPRSWGLPIANGGFFTGLYTYALIEKYRNQPSPETAGEIDILIKGLYLLQDVARVDGFIARGVGEDGRSHYPMGAECQNFPWILALYSYYRSDLCADCAHVRERLLRVLLALRKYEWKIPCDAEGFFYKSGWLTENSWRGVVMLLFCSRIIYELTGDQKDRQYFEELIHSVPENGIFKRSEIVSQGYSHDMITSFGNQTWICLYCHLAVRELIPLDPDRESIYKLCLYNNGVTALKNVYSIKKYDNKCGGFDMDWRKMNTLWEDYEKDTTKGTAISEKQSSYWHQHLVPHRHMEHHILGNALFAAWAAATCEDERIEKKAMEVLKEEIAKIDWNSLHLSYAFAAESALIYSDQRN